MKTRRSGWVTWFALFLAAGAVAQDQFSYTTNHGAITITGYTGPASVLSIPGSFYGLPVTAIGPGAFQNQTNLNSLAMPNTITNIGSSAFANCTSLYGALLPNALRNIGDDAFYQCFQLTGITVPAGVTYIGAWAFYACSSMGSLQLPDQVLSIGPHAFDTCWRLTSVTLGSQLASVGDYAFFGCAAINNLALGANIRTIGTGAFFSCSNLVSVTLPRTLASLGSQAFEDCPALQSAFFLGDAPTDANLAFLNDSMATVYYLPQTAGWGPLLGEAPTVPWNAQAHMNAPGFGIGTNGFGFTIIGNSNLDVVVEACTNLANPAWVAVGTTGLPGGSASFSDPAWKNFTARFYRLRPEGAVPFTYSIAGGALTIMTYTGQGGTVAIPDTIKGLPVTAIAPRAFQLSPPVTNLIIGSYVTSIGDYAFANSSLLSVRIPAAVTHIGMGAFSSSYQLTSLTVDQANAAYSSLDGVIFNKNQTTLVAFPTGRSGLYVVPATVTNIGPAAFAYAHVTGVTLPNGLLTLGDSAFQACNIPDVSIPGSVTSIGDSAFYWSSLHFAVIPGSVATIGNSAFEECQNLTGITLYPGISSIGDRAFANCFSLGSVTLPDTVTNLGMAAFYYCPGLGQAVLGRGIRSIADDAFMACANLRELRLPDTLMYIGEDAFWYCENLTNVVFGPNLQYIGIGAFQFCSGLSSVVIPDTVTTLAAQAFANCSGLAHVVLSRNLNVMSASVFQSCSNLTSITIPAGVTELTSSAFEYCSGLRTIYFTGNAPLVDAAVFHGDPGAIAYYLPGTSGWTQTLGGLRTVLWNAQIQTSSGAFGVGTNGFGFTITGTSNLVIVVEGCTNLSAPAWFPLRTNVLATGRVYFSDPAWRSSRRRFYRLRSP